MERRRLKITKKLLAVMLGLSMIASVTYTQEVKALELDFIDIDLSGTPNPADFPFGIECGDPDFVYVTIFSQGLLAKINKSTKVVEELIDDPEGSGGGQNFYSIARSPNPGELFINERDSGRAWRFDPSTSMWNVTPIVPEIVHPNVDYPFGFNVRPNEIRVNEGPPHGLHTYEFNLPSRGGVVFTNNFAWIGATVNFDFDEFAEAVGVSDVSFSGIVRLDPDTLEATQIPIPGAGFIADMDVDFLDPSLIWIADFTGDKIYKFDTNTLRVVQTISLPAGSNANHIANDDLDIFVALNKEGGPGQNSEIRQINRLTENQNTIDTGAPNTSFGTFSVFRTGDQLVWTDQ
ncbi:MAG: hypothetical protein ACE5KA_08320, partial [Nitrososphaerales archaeon]